MINLSKILSFNPWLEKKPISSIYQKRIRRKEIDLIKEKIGKEGKILVITGPRQVGKTTLIYHFIEKLLKQNVSEKNILYLIFDRPSWQKLETEEIIDLIQEINGIPLKDLEKTFYLFLDEVHKLENWENITKYLLEAFSNIKIVISGSSALNIEIGAGEGLVGRLEILRLWPLSFKEFIEWKKPDLLKEKKFREEEIKILFKEYLKKGGYPGCIFLSNLDEVYNLLLSYKSLSIMRDIVRLLKIGDPALLEDLLDILARLSTERINYSILGRLVGEVNVHTIKKYLNLLEATFFVKQARIFRKKGLKPYRREKKIFFLDVGLKNALLEEDFKDYLIWPKLVENVVVSNYYFYFNKLHPFQKNLYYWLENGGEVDLITEKGFPIEVKYKDKLEKEDFLGIRKFFKETKIKEGLILTKEIKKQFNFPEGKIKVFPVWQWLLEIEKYIK